MVSQRVSRGYYLKADALKIVQAARLVGVESVTTRKAPGGGRLEVLSAPDCDLLNVYLAARTLARPNKNHPSY